MRTVDFEFDGETYTLPRTSDLPLRCFRDRGFDTLIKNAPGDILAFMWDMSGDEARSFMREWRRATREAKKTEEPPLTPLDRFVLALVEGLGNGR
ncbi:hypothetical protein ACSBQT_10765 [Brevibacterium sp. H602]|uniref:hypothetical protein n=1 Tax=Brevibacterium sp. H602 TaxID=3444316 RepID=UPI003EBCB8DE